MHSPCPSMTMPRRITIEEADNGFIVSCYDKEGKEKRIVCSNLEKAATAMTDMMKSKGNKMKYPRSEDMDEEM